MKEVTVNLQIKNGKYYVLLNLYDNSGKRTIKWVALGLDKKSGKKLARVRMAEVIEEYNSAQHKLTVENLTGDELNDFYSWLKGKGLTGASALHYASADPRS